MGNNSAEEVTMNNTSTSLLQGKTALVTGGSGFLGRAIVKQLLDEQVKVKILCRGSYPDLEKLDIEIIRGEISDIDVIKKAVQNSDIVFHTAAKAGIDGPYSEYYRINVEGTQSLFKCAQDSGVKAFIYTSSPSVVFSHGDIENGDETLPYPEEHHAHYPKTKCIAEKFVLTNNSDKMTTVSLRPHLIWGPGDNHLAPRLIKKAKAGKLKFIGDGKNLIDTVYIDNAATAHIQAAKVSLSDSSSIGGKAFFITNGDPRPISEIINMIIGSAGLEPVTATISPKVAWFAGAIFEFIFKVFRLKGEPPITRWVAAELSTAHWFNISLAKKLLNYNPTISIEEGQKRLEEYYNSRKDN